METIARYKAERVEKIGIKIYLLDNKREYCGKKRGEIIDLAYSYEEIMSNGDELLVKLKKKKKSKPKRDKR